jgi:acetate---CoA ligase (ADP-forming) subunit beta
MLTTAADEILTTSKSQGWVLEPEAKRLFSLAGLPVPRYLWAKTAAEAGSFAAEIGFPVVAKVVSAEILHKSDQGGVVVGIADTGQLTDVFDRFSLFPGFAGMLVEEMLMGLELIIGAKMDWQFGPVILLGIGGTRAEIYKDVALRMAPLNEACIATMIKTLRAHRLLEGYRGQPPINLEALTLLMMLFSQLVMDLEGRITSIDLNPVLCSSERCVIADARIMLK